MFHFFEIILPFLQVKEGIAINLIAFLPAALLGGIGGILGSLFTFMNLKFARTRRRLLSKIEKPWLQNIMKMSEPLAIIVSVDAILPSQSLAMSL